MRSLSELLADYDEPFVLGEVCEILDVERRQRHFVHQATRGYPGIVLRTWPTPKRSVGRDLAPFAGHPLGTGKDRDRLKPFGHSSTPSFGPFPLVCPLAEFTKRGEGDERTLADEVFHQGRRQLPLEAQRRDVGVQYDEIHDNYAKLARRAS